MSIIHKQYLEYRVAKDLMWYRNSPSLPTSVTSCILHLTPSNAKLSINHP